MTSFPIHRHDHFIPYGEHFEHFIRVREVSPDRPHQEEHGHRRHKAILFVHGAVMTSVLFDLPVEGYSWQEYFAKKGYVTYALDLRGYGRSTKPAAMELPRASSQPLVTHKEALEDIALVVEDMCHTLSIEQVTLCGLSWGGVLSSMFTEQQPHRVEKLLLLGPVYAVRNPAWTFFMDPEHPETLHPALGGYRYLTEDALFFMWDSEIPPEKKLHFQNEHVRAAILKEMLQGDHAWAEKNDLVAFRTPNGILKDLEKIYNHCPLYDPSAIHCPTLIMRGDHDKASLKEDMDILFEKLAAEKKYYITLGNMSHYALAERRSVEVMRLAKEFLETT